MRSENAIEVQGITKKFKVYLDKGNTLKEKMLFRNRRKYEERIVLDDISFDVKIGEAVGLIGHNGCGKSTTLKLLTKIMYPDTGNIELRGRVSSLIELGAGFHPDMSGRQNIYTNASIFGLTKKEIDRRLNDIIEFSELKDFIDNPVRTYSSGMYMRLAFSVAINVDADILLIDEILAVGDVNFQTKCFEKLHEIKNAGTTIVIVSHSLGQIEQICDTSIWIDGGKIRSIGPAKRVNEEYMYCMERIRLQAVEQQHEKAHDLRNDRSEPEEVSPISENSQDPWRKLRNKVPNFAEKTAIRMGTGEIEFTDVHLLDVKGTEKAVFHTGEDMYINMRYISHNNTLTANFGIGIFREDDVHCYGTNLVIENGERSTIQNEGEVKVIIRNCTLLPGKYYLDIAVHGDYGYIYDDIRRVLSFRMFSKKHDVGVGRLDTFWTVD